MLAIVAFAFIVESEHIRAEWGLAFGAARTVSATVIDHRPSLESNRTCSQMVRIDLAWQAPVPPYRGSLVVCESSAASYPVGRVLNVAVVPGNPSVINESRAEASYGVALESAFLLFVVFAVFAVSPLGEAARWRRLLRVAPKRLRSAAWVPGWVRQCDEVAGDQWQVAVDLSPSPEVWSLLVQSRRDGQRIVEEDRVWIVPIGRTRINRLRYVRYAVVRGEDWNAFWAIGSPTRCPPAASCLPLKRLVRVGECCGVGGMPALPGDTTRLCSLMRCRSSIGACHRNGRSCFTVKGSWELG